jgi:hypothetical protein
MVRVKSSTASLTAVLDTEVKFGSPLYVAVMECDPTERVEVVRVALPPLRFAVPSVVPLSENVTEPVGVLTEEETVAVSVTVFCARTGLGEAASPAEGAILLTVIEWVTSVAAA